MKRCHACLNVLEIRFPVGRRETCPSCGADLHCCLNCTHYSVGAYNDCREIQAERVLEKDRSNFCAFFVFRDARVADKDRDVRESAKSRAEALFKS